MNNQDFQAFELFQRNIDLILNDIVRHERGEKPLNRVKRLNPTELTDFLRNKAKLYTLRHKPKAEYNDFLFTIGAFLECAVIIKEKEKEARKIL